MSKKKKKVRWKRTWTSSALDPADVRQANRARRARVRMGRPKMSIEAHLGLNDDPTIKECKVAIERVCDEVGPSAALAVMERFSIEDVKNLHETERPHFLRQALNLLKNKS